MAIKKGEFQTNKIKELSDKYWLTERIVRGEKWYQINTIRTVPSGRIIPSTTLRKANSVEELESIYDKFQDLYDNLNIKKIEYLRGIYKDCERRYRIAMEYKDKDKGIHLEFLVWSRETLEQFKWEKNEYIKSITDDILIAKELDNIICVDVKRFDKKE